MLSSQITFLHTWLHLIGCTLPFHWVCLELQFVYLAEEQILRPWWNQRWRETLLKRWGIFSDKHISVGGYITFGGLWWCGRECRWRNRWPQSKSGQEEERWRAYGSSNPQQTHAHTYTPTHTHTLLLSWCPRPGSSAFPAQSWNAPIDAHYCVLIKTFFPPTELLCVALCVFVCVCVRVSMHLPQASSVALLIIIIT